VVVSQRRATHFGAGDAIPGLEAGGYWEVRPAFTGNWDRDYRDLRQVVLGIEAGFTGI